MRICFPAAQIGQRILRQIEISEQFRLILLSATIKAAQQPGPLDGPISHYHDPVAQRQCEIKIVEGQENPLPLIESAKLYEVQKYCSMTSHMWDGQWVLANQKRWGALPPDLQALVAKHFKKAAQVQRDDIRRLNNVLEAQLKSKGMAFNYPDAKPFKEVLAKAGFYQEWKTKYGPEAMGKLEKYTGPLA